MIIELIGLPGSGKSHISRELTLRLRSAGMAVSEPARRIGHSPAPLRIPAKLGLVLLFLLLHPLCGFGIIRYVLKSGQKSLGSLAGSLVNLLFVAGLMTIPHRADILLLDQGPLQGLASLFYDGISPVTAGIPAGLPRPDLVIRVAAERAVIAARLSSRRVGGGSRVEADPLHELPRFEAALAAAEGGELGREMTLLTIHNDDAASLDASLESLVSSILEIKNKD